MKGFYRRTLIVFALSLLILPLVQAQDILPKGFAPGEKEQMQQYLNQSQQSNNRSFTTPPEGSKLRNAAEWEEVQALTITWTSFLSVHREIIKSVQQETPVIIICSDSNNVKSNLTSNNIPHVNLSFLQVPFNSVWIRDYMANSVYTADTDSLVLVDWIYNRPRPNDDTVGRSVAALLDLPIHETRQAPSNLLHTGGNYMSDGMGIGFSSMLVRDENSGKTIAQIDQIMEDFLGLNTYIKMTVLPYDDIHHIDMHMKILDEQTLLVGKYPDGISDGPQIEANIQYVLNNYKNSYNEDYRIIRIPMPPAPGNNQYPPSSNYYTYANSTIINNTIIVPMYSESASSHFASHDSTALRIYREAMPGYNVKGVRSGTTISSGGSLHCITHTVGVNEPLVINAKLIRDTVFIEDSYPIRVSARHKSGIDEVKLFYRTSSSAAFQSVDMTPEGEDYVYEIPTQPAQTTVEYYIQARSVSGKIMHRPMPAPQGFYSFTVVEDVTSAQEHVLSNFQPAYPNPSKGITCIPVSSNKSVKGSIKLVDLMGRTTAIIHEGEIPLGNKNFFFDSSVIAPGVYFIETRAGESLGVQKLLIR
jgi:agmatine deiminase